MSEDVVRTEALLDLLQEIAIATNEAASTDGALQFALDTICAFAGWPLGHAYLASETDDVLESTGVFHLEDPDKYAEFREAALRTKVRKGQGLPGAVFATCKPTLIPDMRQEEGYPRRLLEGVGVVSGFAFPVLLSDRAVGVLEFYYPASAELNTDLRRVAMNIGAQIGRVIEREQAAEEIRSSEERLRALTSAALEAIITADERGIVQAWEGGAEQIFGYSQEEAVGQSVELIMPERHVPDHRTGMARYLKIGHGHLIGHTIGIEGRGKDGLEVPIELSLTTWTVHGRRYFTAIIRDVSERARADEQIRESEEWFRKLFRESAVGQAVRGPDGTLMDVNEALCAMVGYLRDELLESGIGGVTHPDDRPADNDTIRTVLLGGSTGYQIEKRYVHKNGSVRWGLSSVSAVNIDGRMKYVLEQVLDITERKEAEAQLEMRNQELQDFAFVASHDLQEPLRRIQSFSDLLEEECHDLLSEESAKYVARIRDASMRMSALISDLLSYSRVATRGERFQMVSLDGVLETVLSDLEIVVEEAGAGLDVGKLPAIEADPVQMRQLFQNLIGNALKFRREGIPPKITVRGEIVAEPATSATGIQAVCRLEVSDNGIGFEPRYTERIFTPFQRLHEKTTYAGTGMGLAICRRIADRHNGHIAVVSTPGVGSTFVVELPVRQDKKVET